MKDAILDSKIKQKALLTLFEQPMRSFSLRELVLRTRIRQNKLKLLLNLFLRNDLVKVTEKKKQFYFQINRHSALFEELSQIFGQPSRLGKRDLVEKIIKSAGQVKLAALSGVFVGQAGASVDMLIVGRCRGKRLDKAVKALEKIAGQEINFAVITEEDYRQRLYSFDWFIKEVMDHNPAIIIDKISKPGRTKRAAPRKRIARVHRRV
jgi:hypothetical protein